jgi:hypothetical protein
MPALYGPGRNAPTGEGNLKRFLEQRPTQVIIVTKDVITQTLSGLRPTITNERPPLSQKPAIMQEFDIVFAEGFQSFFAKRRQLRGQTAEVAPVNQNSDSSEEEEEWSSDESDHEVMESEQVPKDQLVESESI